MKSISDCLESIQNGEHEKYPYTLALTEFSHPFNIESSLMALCQAVESGSDANTITFAKGLALQINQAMLNRACEISQASVTPLDNDTNEADLKREM